MERGGKDDKGNWVDGPAGKIANPVADNASKAGSGLVDGAKGAGGYVSGMWGGKKEQK